VSIQLKVNHGYHHICNGALIAPIYFQIERFYEIDGWSSVAEDARWVLTAAHCVTNSFGKTDNTATLRVTSGTVNLASGGSEVIQQEVGLIIVHPKYDPSTNRNDLALLKLDELAQTHRANKGRRPIALPGVNDAVWINKPYTELIATGWGRKSEGGYASQFLMEVALPLVDNEYCQDVYKTFGYNITMDMLCAGFQTGGKDSCQGDSGGPLFYRPRNVIGQPSNRAVLVGIVSWGLGCARGGGLFGIYSRVAANLEWIEDAIVNNR
jgi:secreted trypsin-like serine protease